MVGGRLLKVFGVVGTSGSGKTVLIERLIPLFRARGVTVSTIKHAHHGFDIDQPGKDSHRQRQAGAFEVLVTSAKRWALLHEMRGDDSEPDLESHLARLADVDLVLVEGYKRDRYPKIEVWRAANGKASLYPECAGITAVAGDCCPEHSPLPRFDLDDVSGIADFIASNSRVFRT